MPRTTPIPYPILRDRRGDVWIGGLPGLTRFRNGTFENVSADYGLAHESVLSLLEDREGAIWIGGYGGGIRRIKDGRLQRFPAPVGPP